MSRPPDPSLRSVKTPVAISNLLLALAGDTTREHVSLGDLMRAMQDRALAALILLLALPNVAPELPGTSALLGVPLMLLTLQLALGRPAWLPQALFRRSLPRSEFAAAVNRLLPWLARAESLVRPRLLPLSGHVARRCVGAVCLVLSTVLALPIPFGNMLPALAISLMAIGLLEGDGVWVLIGFVTAALALSVAAGMTYGLAKAAWLVLTALHPLSSP